MAHRLRISVPVDLLAADRRGADVTGEEILVHLRAKLAEWARDPSAFRDGLPRPAEIGETRAWLLVDETRPGQVVAVPGSGLDFESLDRLRRSGDLGPAALDWRRAAQLPVAAPLHWVELEDFGRPRLVGRLRLDGVERLLDLGPWAAWQSSPELAALRESGRLDVLETRRAIAHLAAEFDPSALRLAIFGAETVSRATSEAIFEGLRRPPETLHPDLADAEMQVDPRTMETWLRHFRPSLLDAAPAP